MRIRKAFMSTLSFLFIFLAGIGAFYTIIFGHEMVHTIHHPENIQPQRTCIEYGSSHKDSIVYGRMQWIKGYNISDTDITSWRTRSEIFAYGVTVILSAFICVLFYKSGELSKYRKRMDEENIDKQKIHEMRERFDFSQGKE